MGFSPAATVRQQAIALCDEYTMIYYVCIYIYTLCIYIYTLYICMYDLLFRCISLPSQ